MATIQAQIDAVRNAVASVSTCTPTISATLKELLLSKEADHDAASSKPTAKTRPGRAKTVSTREKPTATITKRGGAKAVALAAQETRAPSATIAAKERALLATQVINSTLKALGDAVKNPPPQDPRSPANPDIVKPANRKALRRSNSVPMTPLQPRSLNRVSTPPGVARSCRSPSLISASTGCLAAVECARAAFSSLRSLQASGAVTLPELQLESGMSSFINKLIGLNLFEQATKELRILKRRLEGMAAGQGGKKNKSNPAPEPSTVAKTFSDLLDFPNVSASGPLLGLIISTQLQALRVLHGLKRSAHLDTALPFLRQSNSSSPLNLILLSLQGEKLDRTKGARQLESLSQSLLSLSPSIASKDDATAVEPRLSPSPETSLEIQALAFACRLQSWRISGHKGDVDRDVLLPLSKCMGAFARRTSSEPAKTFLATSNAFNQVWECIEKLGLRPSMSSKTSLVAIYQVLGTTSWDAGDINEARKWTLKLKDFMDPTQDSVAKRCSVTAQLLALSLRQSPQVDESLIIEILDALQGPLSGSTTDLDDLLVSICLARKAAISVIVGRGRQDSDSVPAPEAILKHLEIFVFQLPRFALRWLGTPPSSTGATKDFLRFEQRRQLLSKYLSHILDSAFMLINKTLEEDGMAWDQMDSILQDSLGLLENIGMSFQVGRGNPSSSYYVKISHLYYQQHLALRKSKDTETISLRALRRSIECMKQRPEDEQCRAQLLVKWERFAELCRASGRRDDAADALRSIRDHLVRQEIVPAITSMLATQPVVKAWQQNTESEALSRAVCNLAKIDRKPTEWTWLLDESDKATALEHDLYFIISNDSNFRQEVGLSHPTVKGLLHIYSHERYPIRRFRTLLQLLTAHLDTGTETADLRTEVRTAAESITTAELANDNGLERYIPHLQSLATCIFSLADSTIDGSSAKQALARWKAIASRCHSAEELSDHIDNPDQLHTILQSLADFARIRGLETFSADVLELSTRISKLAATGGPDSLLTQSATLCVQHLSLGQSTKVEMILQQNKDLISQPDLSQESLATYHLAVAEYHLALGDFDEADHHLTEARNVVAAPSTRPLARRGTGSGRKILLANASFLSSRLALERGDSPNALHFAKTAVKYLFHDWAKLEELRRSNNDVSVDDLSQSEASGDDSSFSSSQLVKADVARANAGPTFWAMVYPLFRSVLRLSSIYAHVGMYQETLYYAQQAQKVAHSTASITYIFQSEAWLALVSLMAGKPEEALEIAAELKASIAALEPTCSTVTTVCELSRVYRDIEDAASESELLDRADAMVKAMHSNDTVTETGSEPHLETQMAKLTITSTSNTKATTRQAKAKKTTKVVTTTVSKRAPSKRPNTPAEPQLQIQIEDVQISFLRAAVLQYQSMNLLSKKDWATAITNLHTAYQLSKLSRDISQERVLMATGLIGQSLDLMGRDSVFSVIQDSTLSFPAVAASHKDKSASERSPLVKASPRKGRNVVQEPQLFVDNLWQAQEYLLEAHSIATINGDGGLVHRIAALLQNVTILLSATGSSRSTGVGHPAHATCSIELARNLVWRRERKTLRLESAKSTKAEWPMPIHHNSHDNRRSSLGFSIDMNRFQRDYVDVIPKSWNVVSVSLSDNKHDLCITKLQAGHSPFAIRLPLERASSRDADSEVFTFQQGRSELLDIITQANRTCHDARDMSHKEAKSAWWAEREELDERLKELAGNIEQTWLGGFKGIFTQHHKRSDLLAQFQKSFLNILDKHLPSRRQVRGKRAKAAPIPKINLDPRIMDLFIGLGDATAPECDLDEPLNDLLYFVVDILQFHGERNAYDEIDFDAMVVETFDALHSYHSAAKGCGDADEGIHTILILDNALHVFPWESLPCMQGHSVSRVPSLACLRRAILEQRTPHAKAASLPGGDEDELSASNSSPDPNPREGHYASINSGTYILNPSTDLANTAATFGRPLAQLPAAWRSIEGRAPTEAEFEAALRGSDLLLYFGHGSGAQYIRGRTIRQQLNGRCRAAALLMGCSSAALDYAGEAFAPHGPVRNYMLAGCPAVVGTLWDVTDRDIDRFAARLFEEWGLMPRGTFASSEGRGGRGSGAKGKEKTKGKGKGKEKSLARHPAGKGEEEEAQQQQQQPQTSLVEAVARARDACRFRYLTAAAVCVYGIPVYISK
ncbi:hypothetical protein DL763_011339 [Monosporascus cannonballus]|nr:hypothetical protein DL763_011339 [Monosporascus cannonballus]